MKQSFERRTFVKLGLVGLASIPLFRTLTACTKGDDGAAPAGATKIDPATNPTAKALGYHEDGSKVDTTQYPKKGGADGASQDCSNCSFFTAIAENKNWGNCTLIAGGVLAAKGWCNSWTKKA